VDASGVLLPKKAPIANKLPIFLGAPRPAGGAGQPWGDPGVLAAAQAAFLLKLQLEQFGNTTMTWSPEGVVLWREDAKAIWGRPADVGKGDEATLVMKEERLKEAFGTIQPVPWWSNAIHEFDLRPRDAMSHKLMPRQK